ncbi:MAG: hypothetical protein C0P74_008455 [Gammaproteobacteria bacterium]|nr:hypothetical protein [Gammaproteobacteria bacterium]
MFITPLKLIDRTIDHLEILAEVLTDEVNEPLNSELEAERKLCKETLLTIRVLLPKLKAVRCTPVAMTAAQPAHCPSCNEG